MKKLAYVSTAAIFAIAVLVAGCGGGGGSASDVSAQQLGRVQATINFGINSAARPVGDASARAAASESGTIVTETSKMFQGCSGWTVSVYEGYEGEESYTYVYPPSSLAGDSSVIPVILWVSKDPTNISNNSAKTSSTAANPIASACAMLTCTSSGSSRVASSSSSSTMSCSGNFDVKNVLAGSNLLLEATAYYNPQESCYDGECTTYWYGSAYVAGIVPLVVEGSYNSEPVVISPSSTLTSKSAISYAVDTGKTLSALASTDVDKIKTSVSTNFPSGIQYGVTTYDGLVISCPISGFTDALVREILEDAGLSGPKLASFTPTSGSTITYDAPAFAATFDTALDTTIAPTGLKAKITRASTGNSVTIDGSNVASYGAFSYSSDGKTLTYTFKSYSELASAGLSAIKAGVSGSDYYVISDFTLPTNLKDSNGKSWLSSSDTGVPSSFSVYTYSGPIVTSTTPANGATGVAYDGTTFDVVTSASLDSSIAPTGYSITITSSSGGSYVIIDSQTAASYGAFSYVTTTRANDTIRFTLKSNSELSASELYTMSAGATYTISGVTFPTNVKDVQGNALYDPNSVASSSSDSTFMTASSQ